MIVLDREGPFCAGGGPRERGTHDEKVRNDDGFDLGFREACEERKIVGFFYSAEVVFDHVAEEVNGWGGWFGKETEEDDLTVFEGANAIKQGGGGKQSRERPSGKNGKEQSGVTFELRKDKIGSSERSVNSKKALRERAQSTYDIVRFEECKCFQPVKLIMKENMNPESKQVGNTREAAKEKGSLWMR